MTRSVEIPDEALAEAMDAYYSEGQYAREAVEESMRAALVAARPYLMPTREVLAGAIHKARCRADSSACAGEADFDSADAVLALLSSGESGE